MIARAEVNVAREADRPPPIIHLGPVNQTLPIRKSAELPCQASGSGGQEVILWLKDGVPLSTQEAARDRYTVDADNTLLIKSKNTISFQSPFTLLLASSSTRGRFAIRRKERGGRRRGYFSLAVELLDLIF